MILNMKERERERAGDGNRNKDKFLHIQEEIIKIGSSKQRKQKIPC